MNKNAIILIILMLIVMFIFLHYYAQVKESFVTSAGTPGYTKEQQAALDARSAEYKKNPKKSCTIL